MLRASVALVLLALFVAAPASAQGSLFLRGARAYAEGRFEDAAMAFSDAYAEDPDPTYLYHLGRALEGAQDREGAIDAYFNYLAEVPDAPERVEVEATIERLRDEVLAGVEVVPEEETTPPPAETTPRRVSHVGVVERPEGRRISPWPWVVVGGGVLIVGIGAILGGVALGTHDAAAAAPSHAETVSIENEAQAQAAGATAMFVIGTLVTLGGAAWGIVDLVLTPEPEADTADEDTVEARLHLRPDGASLTLTF